MTIEQIIQYTIKEISFPFHTNISPKEEILDKELYYYCTVCEERLEDNDGNNIGICKNHSDVEGCPYCMAKCGDSGSDIEDDQEYHKVKGCGQLFCSECFEYSPWDLSYPVLCKECISRQNVGKYYGEKGRLFYEKISSMEKDTTEDEIEKLWNDY